MRRSTLAAVSATALVLVLAGQWPAIVGDSGWKGARVAVSEVLSWRPPPRIAPRTASAAVPPQRPRGLAPEGLAAAAMGGVVAVLFAVAGALVVLRRSAAPRRRQPLDAERWLAREARAAH